MIHRRFRPDAQAEWLKRGASHFAAVLHRASGRHGGQLGILLHHRVSPLPASLPPAPFNVPPDKFRHQLEGLLERGYRFIPFSEVLSAYRTGKPAPQRSVVLTFDDVYESVYRHAFPIMQELGIPGIGYLSTAYLDSDEPFPFDDYSLAFRGQLPAEDYRPVKISQCREMLASGLFEFGAHTHTHADFCGKPDEFREDVEMSVAKLRELFQLKNVSFAYPWGATGHCEELVVAARGAGVTAAVTTKSVLVDPTVDDHFTWGRFVVFPWDTPATLSAKLAGWYGWARRARASVGSLKRYARRLAPTSAVWGQVVTELSSGASEIAAACAGGLV